MSVATRHLLQLQVTRTNNGKFLVSPNASPDPQAQQQPAQPVAAEEAAPASPPASVAFAGCGEPSPAQPDQHGPTLLGERFLLVGPAEGSTLYRCVDVQTGQQLVAKVSSLQYFCALFADSENAVDEFCFVLS